MNLDSLRKYIDRKSQLLEVCSTGFSQMDSMLRHNGLPTDVLMYVMAKSGTGKTYYATNWIYNVLMLGKKVVFFSYEMSRASILDIVFSLHHDLTMKEIDALTYEAEIDELLINKDGVRIPIENLILYNKSQNVNQIEKILETEKPDYVFIDHVHLVKTVEKDLQYKTIEISGSLREFKREYNTRIIALIQLNRSKQNEGDAFPTMTDMKGSSALEEDADILLALKREDVKKPDAEPIIGAIFRKNRLSGKKQITMSWKYQHGFSKLVEQI